MKSSQRSNQNAERNMCHFCCGQRKFQNHHKFSNKFVTIFFLDYVVRQICYDDASSYAFKVRTNIFRSPLKNRDVSRQLGLIPDSGRSLRYNLSFFTRVTFGKLPYKSSTDYIPLQLNLSIDNRVYFCCYLRASLIHRYWKSTSFRTR